MVKNVEPRIVESDNRKIGKHLYSCGDKVRNLIRSTV